MKYLISNNRMLNFLLSLSGYLSSVSQFCPHIENIHTRNTSVKNITSHIAPKKNQDLRIIIIYFLFSNTGILPTPPDNTNFGSLLSSSFS